MNKMTMIVAAVAVIVIGLVAYSWMGMKAPAPAQPQTPAPAPAAPAPVAKAPVAPAPVVQEIKPLAPLPLQQEIDASAVPEDLKQAARNEFQDKVSFPLDEKKMVAFAKAGLKIEKINQKWDVQIASADTDQMAIEYNNFAVEEISTAMQTMQGINVDQFNELTQLTATNEDFNRVYQAYKQLAEEGLFNAKKPEAAGAATTPASTAVPAAAQPQAAAPATQTAPAATTTTPAAPQPAAAPAAAVPATPASVPANPGTVSAPQGSPAPQYSQQQSR